MFSNARNLGHCAASRHAQIAALIALALSLAPASALAQSAVGRTITGATGQSLADAVDRNQKELIEREALAGGAAGRNGSSLAGGLAVYSTGRLRGSEHDGYSPPSATNFAFKTDEQSVFGNAVLTLPGTVLGGQVKVSGFAGQNWVSLDLKSSTAAVLDPDQSGHGENQSAIAGGSVLWAKGSAYALATAVGFWGQTSIADGVDDCGHSPPFAFNCALQRYKFDTLGFLGSVTAGRVFDLGAPSGPKLDVRASLAYLQNVGDSFHTREFGSINSNWQKYTFSNWTGTFGLTLFQNISLANSALLRPYVEGYIRQEWYYRNSISAVESGGNDLGRTYFEQAHTYGGATAGVTYAIDKLTIGGSVYFEGSSDEHTLGGRVGVSWKLN